MRMLKTGDPCPCCGQPIKWRNPRILQLITYAAAGELTRLGREELFELIKQGELSSEQKDGVSE